MVLSAHMRLREKPIGQLRKALKTYAQVEDEYIWWNLNDGGEAFFRSYELIRAAGNDCLLPIFSVIDDPKVFPEDQKQIVGYVAESLDRLSLRNPPEDYVRPPQGPGQSGLKEEVEMDLDERPKGLFVCVADDYIAHDDWLAYFASDALQGVKPVRYRGKVLAGWNRLRAIRREKVIDDLCFAWLLSPMSGQPVLSTFHDVWFSATGQLVTETVVNVVGKGFYGGGQLIVISPEALARFRKKFRLQRAGLRPLTVYTKATRRYEILSKMQAAIAHITEQHRKEVESGAVGEATMTKEQLEALKALWKLFSGAK